MPNTPMQYNKVGQTGAGSKPSGSPVIAASGVVSEYHKTAQFWSAEQADLFQKWHSAFGQYEDEYQSPYFDYYFTGQDISLQIEGLNEMLPIYNFGYVIQQQKQPVYGFWNYTYSAMLRGTRIISGMFSIVTTTPHYLTRQIAKASENRSMLNSDRTANNDLYALRGLDDDEKNIDKYWYRNYDNNLDKEQQHLFSIHPPFNFKIKYGIQETSLVSNNPSTRVSEYKSKYGSNAPLATDTNERLVKNPSLPEETQILLESIELTSKSTEYDSEGNPILETYSFIARDERILSAYNFQNPNPL